MTESIARDVYARFHRHHEIINDMCLLMVECWGTEDMANVDHYADTVGIFNLIDFICANRSMFPTAFLQYLCGRNKDLRKHLILQMYTFDDPIRELIFMDPQLSRDEAQDIFNRLDLVNFCEDDYATARYLIRAGASPEKAVKNYICTCLSNISSKFWTETKTELFGEQILRRYGSLPPSEKVVETPLSKYLSLRPSVVGDGVVPENSSNI